jgi:adenosylcobyric acid synthase
MGEQLKKYAQARGVIFGVCGGYQMLGKVVNDPDHYEGTEDSYQGLNLLPIKTTITAQKITQQRQSKSCFPQIGLPVIGYEIHQGISELLNFKPGDFQAIFEDADLGIVKKNQSIWGAYLHGIFDNGPWRRSWLNFLRKRRGLATLPTGIPNYQEQREAMFDSLADLVDEYVDLTPILAIINEDKE